MTENARPNALSWCLLALIVAGVIALIAVAAYAIWHTEETPRGLQGPVMQSSPRSDPPPTFMKPGLRPDR
jgi:hypothetical protein